MSQDYDDGGFYKTMDATFPNFDPDDVPPGEPSGKRKRGAQPGNHNALKYGFYSRLIHPEAGRILDKDLGHLNDEITFLRSLVYQTVQNFKENPPQTPLDSLRAMRTITSALNCLRGFYRTQQLVFNENGHTMDEVIQMVMDELGNLDPSED